MIDGDPFSDAEQREFIESLPHQFSYSEIEVRCREKFGPRGWLAAKIADFWNRNHPPRVGGRSKIYDDKEVRDFIEDRFGRLTLDEIHAACLERFGPDRTPSRTSIHDHWKRLRASRAWRGRVLNKTRRDYRRGQ